MSLTKTEDKIETLVNDNVITHYIRKTYHDNILTKVEYLNSEKQLHREDNPALIYLNRDGTILSEFWYQNGKQHRTSSSSFSVGEEDGEDLPAIIIYKNNKIIKKIWCSNNKIHRDGNLPAYIKYDLEGKIIKQEYYLYEHKYDPNYKIQQLNACLHGLKESEIIKVIEFIKSIRK